MLIHTLRRINEVGSILCSLKIRIMKLKLCVRKAHQQYLIFFIKKILKECDWDKDLNVIQKIKFRNKKGLAFQTVKYLKY